MRLLKAKISSFRSIADTTLVVDPKVTILVGPNEGGKTNILRALESLGPDKEFVETAVCQFSPAYGQGQSPEIQLLFGGFFAIEDGMFAQALEADQSGATRLRIRKEHGQEETVEANVADDTQVPESTDSEDVIPIVPSSIPRIPSFTRLTVTRQGNDIRDFAVHLDDSEVFPADTDEERDYKSKFLDSLPRFLYFADVNLLRGEIELDQLLSDDPAYEAERNLLRLGGIAELDTLAGHPHRRDVALKNAEQRVTERLRKYWLRTPRGSFISTSIRRLSESGSATRREFLTSPRTGASAVAGSFRFT